MGRDITQPRPASDVKNARVDQEQRSPGEPDALGPAPSDGVQSGFPASDAYAAAGDPLNAYLEHFSESLDALRATCTVLERKSAKLNWALEEANRRLSESLREREQLASRLDSILRCLSVGVVAVDLAGRLIEFNDAAERITGRAKGTVLGTEYHHIVGIGVDERRGPLYTMETGTAIEDEDKEITTAEGERVPVGFSTSLVKGKGGEVMGAVEVFHDLRKAKMLEEELLRSRTAAALGEMAAEVARQIRDPLAGISGFAELLGREFVGDPARRATVSKIQQGVVGIENAIARLLERTRPLPGDFRTLDVRPLVQRVLDLFEGSLESTEGIRLARHIPPSEVCGRVNEEQLRQALWNLLVNAREAMPRGGVLTVRVETEQEIREENVSAGRDPRAGHAGTPVSTVLITVSDTGTGMTSDVADQALSPFFTTKDKRMGLGLTTVRRIAAGHGGELDVDTRVDQGTTMTLRFPSHAATGRDRQ